MILSLTDAQFRGILDSAYDAVIIVNREGLILFANQHMLKWFGYAPEELIGRNMDMLIPAKHLGGHRAHHDRYMNLSLIHI